MDTWEKKGEIKIINEQDGLGVKRGKLFMKTSNFTSLCLSNFPFFFQIIKKILSSAFVIKMLMKITRHMMEYILGKGRQHRREANNPQANSEGDTIILLHTSHRKQNDQTIKPFVQEPLFKIV